MEEKKPRQRGQVTPLGDGKFKIAVPLGTVPGGRRPYHNETLKSSTEAQAWKRVNALLVLVDSGKYFSASRQTVRELMAEYMDRLKRRGLKQSTLESYQGQIDSHIIPGLGDFPLSKLTLDTVQAFYDSLQDKKFKSSFVRLIHQRLKSALAFAKTRKRIESNPTEGAELPPPTKKKKAKVFDEQEALDFIEAAWREPDDIMFIFVLLTGMRPSEFFGLAYDDLSLATEADKERGRADITRAVARRKGGGWYLSTPKTESSIRTIYFPVSIYNELMATKGERLERLKKLGQKHQLVFANERGEALSRASAQRRFNKVCKRAGISTEGRSLYTLRRSHATISLLVGENPKSLSERLGHVSVEFTQDEYVDVLPAMRQIAADKLESRLLSRHFADEGDSSVM
jgi:integrase